MTVPASTSVAPDVSAERLFDRFDVVAELGTGGYGRVMLCADRESGDLVALKELRRVDPDALIRFKNEFRALADVRHENVVRLHELLEGERRWGFTLEYVPGREPISWVRSTTDERGFDESRARQLMRGLLEGLRAIHGHGLLHRDVKPENVRVTPAGRVVLLDFGLATHLEGGVQTADAEIVGTAWTMAPEVGEGAKLTSAADLYAAGVVLYEALTGIVPFDGQPLQIMYAKAVSMPRRPSEVVSGVPPDLDALCMGLLATKPEERLRSDAALALLGGGVEGARTSDSGVGAREAPFVGRKSELAALDACRARVATEGFRLVLVEGESGIGKSALVERFVADRLRDESDAWVWSGRCHAAEQVGFNAFDGIVDELAATLRGLDHRTAAALVPPDCHRVTVLFPVLEGVRAIARAQAGTPLSTGERFPYFEAFRALLARIAASRTVVLVVDDLQWADEGSLALLRFFLDTPRAPHLLVIATVRPLDSLDDALGEGLRNLARRPGVSRIGVPRLSAEESRALAAGLAAVTDADPLERVAAASGGHPLFVQELVRHGRAGVASDLDAALEARVLALPPLHRRALEVACIAGGPLPSRVFGTALGEPGEALADSLFALRLARLLRAVKRGESVVYHDRIREAVLRGLGAETAQAHHRSLALAWSTTTGAEPARVGRHWLGCGEPTEAAPWLIRAAEQAARGAAFEEAASHYEALLSLDEVPRTAEETSALTLAWSEALASAGRCAASAHVLQRALETAGEDEAPELGIRAAQRLLQAGQVTEGLHAVQDALGRLGLATSRSTAGVVARLAGHRIAIALRSFEVRAQPREVTLRERTELDALRRLALPLAWADILRGAELSSRHARLALATAEPDHVAYALAGEAGVRALQGAHEAQYTAMFAQAEAWRARTGHDELLAFECFHRGGAALYGGDVRGAARWLAEAETTYRTRCPGARWELGMVRGPLLASWHMVGSFRTHGELAQQWMDEASLRDDRFAAACYAASGLGCWRHLYVDAPDRAHHELATAMAPFRGESVGVQHFAEAIAAGWVYAYEGGGDAEAFWQARWTPLTRSFLARLPWMRDALMVARVGTLLARTRADGLDATTRRFAASCLRRLPRKRTAYGMGYGALLAAQLAYLEGDLRRAAEGAREAYDHCERMGFYGTHYADVLLAHATNAPDAEARTARAIDVLAGEGFVDPRKALTWWLPVARTFM